MSWVPSINWGDWGVERGESAGSSRQITPPITFVSEGIVELLGDVQRMVREKEIGWSGERILW